MKKACTVIIGYLGEIYFTEKPAADGAFRQRLDTKPS